MLNERTTTAPQSDQRRSGRKRKLTLATIALGSVAGVALAFWTATGTGDGQASTGDVESLVLTQTSTVAGLAPGSDPQALSGTFTNPNDEAVYVHDVTATVTTDTTGCTAADYTIGGSAVVDDEVDDGDTWSGLTIAFNNSETVNQDVCQGATVTIHYTANAS